MPTIEPTPAILAALCLGLILTAAPFLILWSCLIISGRESDREEQRWQGEQHWVEVGEPERIADPEQREGNNR